MNILLKLFTSLSLAIATGLLNYAQAQEAPDVMVERISHGILEAVRSDKEIQRGNRTRIAEFVEQQVMPHVDFQRTTAMAVGRHWHAATTEQQQHLIREFRNLLMHTYAGAMSQIRDPKLEFKPFRGDPDDTEAEVRFQVRRSRGGDPVQVGYRLTRSPTGWKIYDVNVLGVWLIETYKGDFSETITRSGIDGLIKGLSEKNKQLGASAGAPKSE